MPAGAAPGLLCRQGPPPLPEPRPSGLRKALGVALLWQRAPTIGRGATEARLALAAWSASLMHPPGARIMPIHLGEAGRDKPPVERTARGVPPGTVRLQPPRLEPWLAEPQARSIFKACWHQAEPPVLGERVEASLDVRFSPHMLVSIWERAGERVHGLLGPKGRPLALTPAQQGLLRESGAYPRDRKVPYRLFDGGHPERTQWSVALQAVLPADVCGAGRLPLEPLDQRVAVGVEGRRIGLGPDAVSPRRSLFASGAPALCETRLVAQRVAGAEPMLRGLVGLLR